jgi:hypothetical protein
LHARFFVSRNDEVVRREGAAVVAAGVEIEYATRLPRKIGIAGEDPGAVLPRSDRVVVQPPPHGLVADGGDDATLLRLAHDVRGTEA